MSDDSDSDIDWSEMTEGACFFCESDGMMTCMMTEHYSDCIQVEAHRVCGVCLAGYLECDTRYMTRIVVYPSSVVVYIAGYPVRFKDVN
jgi:hypothetical protein